MDLVDHRKDTFKVTGVILAGGRGARMNSADKPLLSLAGKPIIDYVIENARLQVDELLVSANRNVEQYAKYGFPVVQDTVEEYAGPLAGILSAMDWSYRNKSHSRLIACFPGDVPWFPEDVVYLLTKEIDNEDPEITWLCTDGQFQPLFSLWSINLRTSLREALVAGVYSPMQFIRSRKNKLLILNNNPAGYFDNLNNPEDLERAEVLIKRNNVVGIRG